MRVMVTGSRTWTDWRTLTAALALVWEPDAVLVSGACPKGADNLAERCWRHWGGTVERMPAEWARCGRSAGFCRNRAMARSGVDVCVAFIRAGSRGATHAVECARREGVPTYMWRAE